MTDQPTRTPADRAWIAAQARQVQARRTAPAMRFPSRPADTPKEQR